jgi:hypothetical protein
METIKKEDLNRLAQIAIDTFNDPKLFGLDIDLCEVAVKRLLREKNPPKVIKRKSPLKRRLSIMRSRIKSGTN